MGPNPAEADPEIGSELFVVFRRRLKTAAVVLVEGLEPVKSKYFC